MSFFQAQGRPVQQQQQQYSPVFQQPQNIYQQLGKPQPQPHLQSHPNFVQQQPPPIQTQGFQFSQPQYAQPPPQAAQTPFPMSQTPFASPQTPYPPSQTPYLPTQTPFAQPFTVPQTPFAPQQTPFTQQQAPYPVSQTPYAQAQTPYPPPQQYPVQQTHPVPAPTQVPTSSFPNKASGMVPTSSAGTSWRPATTARCPPISPSATLAQHATAQQAQVALQTQQSHSTIQTPTRRPLPQPSPGANAKTPVLPPTNSHQRAPTLASAKSAPGSSKPFPTVQPIQTTVPPSSKTPSPTRSRPLPTPTAANKRATVDLGQLVSGSASPALSTTAASSSAFSATSSTLDKRSQSPTKFSLPTPPSLFQNKPNESTILSRTSSYAIGINKNPASTSGTSALPNRRASPPRFQSNPNSSSSSPVKEAPPSTSWKTTTTSTPPSTTTTTIAARSTPPSSSAPCTSTNTTTDTKSSSSPTSTAPPKKFTPLWRRTIPEMPAPAWGYAAGMVSEPHPKPAPQTAQQQPGSPEKGKGKLQKKIGPPKAPTPSVAPTRLNTQYPKASTFEQRQSYYQQPLGSLPALSQPTQLAHSRIPAGYAPQGRQQQAQEQEETEETEEDDEEEESDEGDEESEGESDYPAQRRNRSHGRYGYEPEQRASPTKKILRPREKVDPYGGYMDVSPIGRKDGSGSPTKVNIRPKFRERVQRYQEELQDRKPKKVLREREPVELRSHERSRSAFEEREIVRHKREVASERERPRPGSAFARRRKYEDDDDEDDVRLAYEDEDDEESEEEEWRNMPKRGAATGRTRERVREWERDLDQREGKESRPAASPQWGIRDLPSAAQRRALSTGPATRYRDEYGEEEEYRRGPSRERVYRDDQDPGLRYRGGSTGPPQPPAMTRKGRGSPEKSQGGPRRKTTPLKHHEDEDDQDTTPRRPANQGQSLHMRFSAINLNGGPNGNRNDSRSSSSSGAWPADLPRLPRTPGSATTPGGVSNDAGGYFDVRPPQQGMSSQGSDFRHNQVHGTPNQRPNLNIDDPPPRATIVRTPSPGPSGYTFKRELPQQPRSRPQSQAYPQNTANEQLQRRRSLYSAPSEPIHQEVNASPQRRPQSQIYASSHGNSQPMFGHGQHQQPQQYCHNQSHPGSQPQLSFPDQGPQFSFDNRQQPQTPAPPALVGIESPHPIGGREKLADIPKLEEDSNDGSDHERTVPSTSNSNVSRIHVDSGPPSIPMINIDSSPRMSNAMPMINVEPPRINVGSDTPRKQASQGANRPNVQVFEVPGVSVSGPEFDAHHSGPNINISGPDDHGGHHHGPRHEQHQHQPRSPPSQHSQFAGQQYGQQQRPGGLICGGCHGPIIGRIVSAMGSRWHPSCFKCAVCGELLEHVSSYEHDGRPYCHLDYHENFAPRCYSCKTAIIEEQFISLDDPALGKRTYHTQHFFCAECGDPFLDTSTQLATDSNGELALCGDGEFEGFTVYKGHPYCEACHVRLRLPKCKRCKKSIRDHEEAVEALGGKWCWSCFVCASCHKPFEDPSFFQRGDQPYCEHCFSIMLRNEV